VAGRPSRVKVMRAKGAFHYVEIAAEGQRTVTAFPSLRMAQRWCRAHCRKGWILTILRPIEFYQMRSDTR
jgi:hypothetical protein